MAGGVNNALNAQGTLNLSGGNLTTNGGNNITLTTTGLTNITLPASGTIATTSQLTSWSSVSTSGSISANSGTVATGGTLVTLTLPVTASLGATFFIVGIGAGGWKIAQNSGQIINFGNVQTTSGTAGSLASNNQFDSVFLVCTVANTTFNVISAQGNLTVL